MDQKHLSAKEQRAKLINQSAKSLKM